MNIQICDYFHGAASPAATLRWLMNIFKTIEDYIKFFKKNLKKRLAKLCSFEEYECGSVLMYLKIIHSDG
jgi:hypothetical protein